MYVFVYTSSRLCLCMWGFIFLWPVRLFMHRCSFLLLVASIDVVVLFLFIALAFICFKCRFILLHLDRSLRFPLVRELNCEIYINMLTCISSAACVWHCMYIFITERERKIKNTLLSNNNANVPFFKKKMRRNKL